MHAAKSNVRGHFAYFVEPSRRVTITAVVAVVIPVVLALIAPILLFRVVLLALAVGPGLWLLLEWLRRGRGVRLEGDHLVIEAPYTRRSKRIDYVDIHAHAVLGNGGLALAYRKALPALPDPNAGKAIALTQTRSASEGKLRPGLAITLRLSDPAGLQAELTAHLAATPANVEPIPPAVLVGWVARRRVRNFIVGAILFFLTPLWVIIIMQILFSFMRIGGH